MIRALKQKFAPLWFALALILVVTPVARVQAADHGDAPTTGQDLAADLNDLYFFLDPNDNSRVIMIMTIHGFIAAGENANFGIFDPALRYRFEIEQTGDAKPDSFIDVRFTQRTAVAGAPIAQTATLSLSGFGNNRTFTAPTTNSSVASSTAPAPVITTDTPSGITVFAGLTDDPFFFDIPAFGRFTASVRAGTPNPSVFQRGRDSFAGYNTMAIALSVPAALVRGAGNELGLSCATQRRSPQVYNARTNQIQGFGRWVNVDRTGVPAVNVALVPFNLKDEFNTASTLEDAAGRFAPAIVGTLNLFGTDATSQGILASVAITRGDILRLNLTTANSGMGGGNNAPAAFPNGRRLRDDVIDTELFLINNRQVLSDNANANDVPFRDAFPFLAPAQQPREPGTIDDNTRN